MRVHSVWSFGPVVPRAVPFCVVFSAAVCSIPYIALSFFASLLIAPPPDAFVPRLTLHWLSAAARDVASLPFLHPVHRTNDVPATCDGSPSMSVSPFSCLPAPRTYIPYTRPLFRALRRFENVKCQFQGQMSSHHNHGVLFHPCRAVTPTYGTPGVPHAIRLCGICFSQARRNALNAAVQSH